MAIEFTQSEWGSLLRNIEGYYKTAMAHYVEEGNSKEASRYNKQLGVLRQNGQGDLSNPEYTKQLRQVAKAGMADILAHKHDYGAEAMGKFRQWLKNPALAARAQRGRTLATPPSELADTGHAAINVEGQRKRAGEILESARDLPILPTGTRERSKARLQAIAQGQEGPSGRYETPLDLAGSAEKLGMDVAAPFYDAGTMVGRAVGIKAPDTSHAPSGMKNAFLESIMHGGNVAGPPNPLEMAAPFMAYKEQELDPRAGVGLTMTGEAVSNVAASIPFGMVGEGISTVGKGIWSAASRVAPKATSALGEIAAKVGTKVGGVVEGARAEGYTLRAGAKSHLTQPGRIAREVRGAQIHKELLGGAAKGAVGFQALHAVGAGVEEGPKAGVKELGNLGTLQSPVTDVGTEGTIDVLGHGVRSPIGTEGLLGTFATGLMYGGVGGKFKRSYAERQYKQVSKQWDRLSQLHHDTADEGKRRDISAKMNKLQVERERLAAVAASHPRPEILRTRPEVDITPGPQIVNPAEPMSVDPEVDAVWNRWFPGINEAETGVGGRQTALSDEFVSTLKAEIASTGPEADIEKFGLGALDELITQGDMVGASLDRRIAGQKAKMLRDHTLGVAGRWADALRKYGKPPTEVRGEVKEFLTELAMGPPSIQRDMALRYLATADIATKVADRGKVEREAAKVAKAGTTPTTLKSEMGKRIPDVTDKDAATKYIKAWQRLIKNGKKQGNWRPEVMAANEAELASYIDSVRQIHGEGVVTPPQAQADIATKDDNNHKNKINLFATTGEAGTPEAPASPGQAQTAEGATEPPSGPEVVPQQPWAPQSLRGKEAPDPLGPLSTDYITRWKDAIDKADQAGQDTTAETSELDQYTAMAQSGARETGVLDEAALSQHEPVGPTRKVKATTGEEAAPVHRVADLNEVNQLADPSTSEMSDFADRVLEAEKGGEVGFLRTLLNHMREIYNDIAPVAPPMEATRINPVLGSKVQARGGVAKGGQEAVLAARSVPIDVIVPSAGEIRRAISAPGTAEAVMGERGGEGLEPLQRHLGAEEASFIRRGEQHARSTDVMPMGEVEVGGRTLTRYGIPQRPEVEGVATGKQRRLFPRKQVKGQVAPEYTPMGAEVTGKAAKTRDVSDTAIAGIRRDIGLYLGQLAGLKVRIGHGEKGTVFIGESKVSMADLDSLLTKLKSVRKKKIAGVPASLLRDVLADVRDRAHEFAVQEGGKLEQGTPELTPRSPLKVEGGAPTGRVMQTEHGYAPRSAFSREANAPLLQEFRDRFDTVQSSLSQLEFQEKTKESLPPEDPRILGLLLPGSTITMNDGAEVVIPETFSLHNPLTHESEAFEKGVIKLGDHEFPIDEIKSIRSQRSDLRSASPGQLYNIFELIRSQDWPALQDQLARLNNKELATFANFVLPVEGEDAVYSGWKERLRGSHLLRDPRMPTKPPTNVMAVIYHLQHARQTGDTSKSPAWVKGQLDATVARAFGAKPPQPRTIEDKDEGITRGTLGGDLVSAPPPVTAREPLLQPLGQAGLIKRLGDKRGGILNTLRTGLKAQPDGDFLLGDSVEGLRAAQRAVNLLARLAPEDLAELEHGKPVYKSLLDPLVEEVASSTSQRPAAVYRNFVTLLDAVQKYRSTHVWEPIVNDAPALTGVEKQAFTTSKDTGETEQDQHMVDIAQASTSDIPSVEETGKLGTATEVSERARPKERQAGDKYTLALGEHVLRLARTNTSLFKRNAKGEVNDPMVLDLMHHILNNPPGQWSKPTREEAGRLTRRVTDYLERATGKKQNRGLKKAYRGNMLELSKYMLKRHVKLRGVSKVPAEFADVLSRQSPAEERTTTGRQAKGQIRSMAGRLSSYIVKQRDLMLTGTESRRKLTSKNIDRAMFISSKLLEADKKTVTDSQRLVRVMKRSKLYKETLQRKMEGRVVSLERARHLKSLNLKLAPKIQRMVTELVSHEKTIDALLQEGKELLGGRSRVTQVGLDIGQPESTPTQTYSEILDERAKALKPIVKVSLGDMMSPMEFIDVPPGGRAWQVDPDNADYYVTSDAATQPINQGVIIIKGQASVIDLDVALPKYKDQIESGTPLGIDGIQIPPMYFVKGAYKDLAAKLTDWKDVQARIIARAYELAGDEIESEEGPEPVEGE